MNFSANSNDYWLSLPVDYSYEGVLLVNNLILDSNTASDNLSFTRRMENLQKIWGLDDTRKASHKCSDEDDTSSCWDSSSTRSSAYSKDYLGMDSNPFENSKERKAVSLSSEIAFNQGLLERNQKFGELLQYYYKGDLTRICTIIQDAVIGKNASKV